MPDPPPPGCRGCSCFVRILYAISNKEEVMGLMLMVYNRGGMSEGRKISIVRRGFINLKVHILMSPNLNGLEWLYVGLYLRLTFEKLGELIA